MATRATKLDFWEAIKKASNGKPLAPWGFDETNLPNVCWLQSVLSTLNPDHEYFDKKYENPTHRVQDHDEMYIDNQDDFFTGLPKPKNRPRKYKKRDITKLADYKPMDRDQARAKVERIVRQKSEMDQ
jgi:hypothetical protein